MNDRHRHCTGALSHGVPPLPPSGSGQSVETRFRDGTSIPGAPPTCLARGKRGSAAPPALIQLWSA